MCVSAGINFEMGFTFGHCQVQICSDRHAKSRYNFVKMFTLTCIYPTPPLIPVQYNRGTARFSRKGWLVVHVRMKNYVPNTSKGFDRNRGRKVTIQLRKFLRIVILTLIIWSRRYRIYIFHAVRSECFFPSSGFFHFPVGYS